MDRQDEVKTKLGEISLDLFEVLGNIKGYELFVNDMIIVKDLNKALALIEKSEKKIKERQQ